MVIDCPGSQWVLKMGPITRTNAAASRKQAEDGAPMMIRDAVNEIMDQARPLVPLLQKGAQCAGSECGEPTVKEVTENQQAVSYQLPDGRWFSIGSSGAFGVTLVCKRDGE